MINEFFTDVMNSEKSETSYRLLDTLRNLCYAVARLKHKDTIDTEDAKDVMEFYNGQLRYWSEIADVPSDPRDLVYHEIIKKLTGEKFSSEFIELLQAVRG